MADEQQAEVQEGHTEEQSAPVRTARNSQAVYDATRKERKAKAAEVVAANAKAAQAAKRKALAKEPARPGVAEFNRKALEIEKRIAKPKG